MTGEGLFFTGHLCTGSVKQGRLNTEMGHLFPTGVPSIARALPSRLQRPIQNDPLTDEEGAAADVAMGGHSQLAPTSVTHSPWASAVPGGKNKKRSFSRPGPGSGAERAPRMRRPTRQGPARISSPLGFRQPIRWGRDVGGATRA